MLTGPIITEVLETCGITHVVWIPDTHLGTWESALLQSNTIHLIRACREGEAIAIAGGLMLGGAKPIVMIQCTGMFEAGDALRNIVHDLKLPLLLIVGVRSYLAHQEGKSSDNCPVFTGPILDVWEIPTTLLDPNKHPGSDLVTAIRGIQRSGTSGAILIAE
jgi:sulfopyruvate decarboxylase TPP-binding subunit